MRFAHQRDELRREYLGGKEIQRTVHTAADERRQQDRAEVLPERLVRHRIAEQIRKRAVGEDGDGVTVFRDQSSYCASIVTMVAVKAEVQNGQISQQQGLYKVLHMDGVTQLMQRVHVRKIEQGSFDCGDALGPGMVWKIRVLDGEETGLEGYVVDAVFDQS